MLLTLEAFFSLTEAPKLNSTCKGSMKWLSIRWTPPPMTYDILTGYNVWWWNKLLNWTKFISGTEKLTLNFTDLGNSHCNIKLGGGAPLGCSVFKL